jgi:hypothetical protein
MAQIEVEVNELFGKGCISVLGRIWDNGRQPISQGDSPMKRTRAEMKADLTKRADEVIDELLNWTEDMAVPTLTQIEDILLKLRQRLSERMAQAVIESQESIRSVLGPPCPTCGQELHYKDQKPNTVESRVGVLPLTRGYYCLVG